VTGESVWYGDANYVLADNGSWDNFAWVGGYCDSGDCTATINLGGLYASVGGFMNYAESGGYPSGRGIQLSQRSRPTGQLFWNLTTSRQMLRFSLPTALTTERSGAFRFRRQKSPTSEFPDST
jgi:hypothetical protein